MVVACVSGSALVGAFLLGRRSSTPNLPPTITRSVQVQPGKPISPPASSFVPSTVTTIPTLPPSPIRSFGQSASVQYTQVRQPTEDLTAAANYLYWFAQFEQARVADMQRVLGMQATFMQQTQQGAIEGMDNPYPSSAQSPSEKRAVATMFGIAQHEQQVADSFRNHPAPPSCRSLASAYQAMLDNMKAFYDRQSAILSRMQGESVAQLKVDQQRNEAEGQRDMANVANLKTAANQELNAVRANLPNLQEPARSLIIR